VDSVNLRESMYTKHWSIDGNGDFTLHLRFRWRIMRRRLEGGLILKILRILMRSLGRAVYPKYRKFPRMWWAYVRCRRTRNGGRMLWRRRKRRRRTIRNRKDIVLCVEITERSTIFEISCHLYRFKIYYNTKIMQCTTTSDSQAKGENQIDYYQVLGLLEGKTSCQAAKEKSCDFGWTADQRS